MASGNKNYFRHSFFARNDEFVCKLIDKFGLSGYYYWFALLELCAEQMSENKEPVCRFHESRLYRELRCNSRRLKPVLDYMQTSRKLVYNQSETTYEVSIPNLLKYLGSYNQKTPLIKENKIKENKTKINKKKINKKNNFDFENLYEKYPRKIGKRTGLDKLKKQIKTQEDFNRLKRAIENFATLHKNTEPKFIKHFSTFATHWEDYETIPDSEVPITEDQKDELFKQQLQGLIEKARKEQNPKGLSWI